MLPEGIFDFLVQLSINNNKEWFHNNKPFYQKAKTDFETYVDELIGLTNNIDKRIGHPKAKDCTFRIFRDVRFSNNKLPYKNNFGAHINRDGRKSIYGGYYLHIEPDNSFIGGGIHVPQPNELKKIRSFILENPEEYRSIINDKTFNTMFPEMYGDKLKTAPKGFDKNDENIALIRNKSYTVITQLSDDEVQSSELNTIIENTFKTIKPLNDFLNEALEN
ncbi:DUF2461 domain-containing protein [Saccharicrinis aurantiacus]|uniref:DUF2461 domain-containing protein n=1 Tax=Saccharicrinis aurantiacus TaxID=1849719 RepID=UPI00094FE580|nr:DUF2461 domain-containing protein [Saccharicrinis aurantiacus]